MSGKTKEKKESLRATIKRRVEKEERAFRIVEKMVLTDTVERDFFLNAAMFITVSNYKDIVEERGMTKLCGYPLCNNRLTQVLKQKYKISLKEKKVYDITERKNFCSNECYKASKYYESQLLAEPVWMRDDRPSLEFKLLEENEDLKNRFSGSGEEIVIEANLDINYSNPDNESETSSERIRKEPPSEQFVSDYIDCVCTEVDDIRVGDDDDNDNNDDDIDDDHNIDNNGRGGDYDQLHSDGPSAGQISEFIDSDDGDDIDDDHNIDDNGCVGDYNRLHSDGQINEFIDSDDDDDYDDNDDGDDDDGDYDDDDSDDDDVKNKISLNNEELHVPLANPQRKADEKHGTLSSREAKQNGKSSRKPVKKTNPHISGTSCSDGTNRTSKNATVDKTTPEFQVTGHYTEHTLAFEREKERKKQQTEERNTFDVGKKKGCDALKVDKSVPDVSKGPSGKLNDVGPACPAFFCSKGDVEDKEDMLKRNHDIETVYKTLVEWCSAETWSYCEKLLRSTDVKEQEKGRSDERRKNGGEGEETIRKTSSMKKKHSIPSIDSKSPMAIRGKIVSEKLTKALSPILSKLGLTLHDVSAGVTNILKTLRFSNTNIVLNPSQWTLVGLTILLTLIRCDPLLKSLFDSQQKDLHSLLGDHGASESDLERLVKVFIRKNFASVVYQTTLNSDSTEFDMEELD